MPVAMSFTQQHTQPEVDYPRPERLVSGNPKRSTWNHYSNTSGEVFAGVWSCEVGSWRIEMGSTEDEFFFVTEGRCRLTDEAGIAVTAQAGESLLIPAGFKGVFAVLEPMQKHYMIVERKT
ncbi:MAG: cupin domain-containing protein [Steroidobacteraceae bacterium]